MKKSTPLPLLFLLLLLYSLSIVSIGQGNVVDIYPSMSHDEIQSILGSLTPGSIVVFHPGTYPGDYTVTGVGDIVIKGVDAVINSSISGFTLGNSAGNIVVEGFTFYNISGTAIKASNTNGLIIRDVSIINSGVGISLSSMSNASITSVEIDNTVLGIVLGSISRVVINNTVITNNDRGIVAVQVSSIYLFNSSIINCRSGVIVDHGSFESIYTVYSGNNVAVNATSSSLTIYFNQFLNNQENAVLSQVSSAAFTTGTAIDYEYNGQWYHGVVGNYWSGTGCNDTDGDGIGESPVPVAAGYYDTAPICPSYTITNYQLYFINPGLVAIQHNNTVQLVEWKNTSTAKITLTGKAWYVFHHPVLGTIRMNWPAITIVENLTMIQLPGNIRIAATSRIIDYKVTSNNITIILETPGQVALAIPGMEPVLIIKNNETITPKPVYTVYNDEIWTMTNGVDPVKIVIMLQPIPAPEPRITPIILFSAVITVFIIEAVRYSRKRG